ncbi:hypothetical protein NIES4075_48400 [Tolypothrix sp. NIES-4075]|nr:hypothetical protein NIES4075_48400 [Tolypothrix sp. NIES-4075]
MSLRAQRSGVKQSHILRLLHYAVASFAMTNMFLQNWDAPFFLAFNPANDIIQLSNNSQYGSVRAGDAINRRLYKGLIIVKTGIYRVFVIYNFHQKILSEPYCNNSYLVQTRLIA